MPEIVVISGKGGTGKTSLTAAFAHLAENKIICDLDVDAPDLHLLLRPEHQMVEEFRSGHEARIDPERCLDCGICTELCRFGAITRQDRNLVVNPLKCEGCKVCVHFCPNQAIDFDEKHCGTWYVSNTRFGPMVHAQLFPGEENSGRLVSLLRQKARELAKEKGLDIILCDGAPGIGCPVISSLAGTDLAVVITEPTVSGAHDLERVSGLCAHFRIPAAVIINKADINPAQTGRIKDMCRKIKAEVLAELPYDQAMTEAMVQARTITEFQDNGLAALIRQAWIGVRNLADLKKAA
jgi:MinD superfamily P-loop ATPase